MSLTQIDLTTALRPTLLQNESLLFVQDAVGLYRGKTKLPDYQNGQTYLTTHRACYVDNVEPRERCVAVDLKHVDRAEVYAGFLKSSPKVTLIPKTVRFGLVNSSQSDSSNSSPAPPKPSNATWICQICSYSNPVPAYFDPATASESTPLQPCLTCGIKPSLAHILKASIAGITASRNIDKDSPARPEAVSTSSSASVAQALFQCPRCTFQNHPSLLACEICGASLVSRPSQRHGERRSDSRRGESPATSTSNGAVSDGTEVIKFSFRAGGEKIFYERLRGALQQRKWLTESAPPPPNNAQKPEKPSVVSQRSVGIAGLELRGQQLRKNNEVVIGNAFEDLEALMASAKEIITLAESLTPHNQHLSGDGHDASTDPSALLSQLNLTTTRDMLSASSGGSLYLNELARSLAEFLTDDVRGILRHEGGIITLVDLWSVYNRSRGGVELVSPTDFIAATELFEKLSLPIQRRTFRSGLIAVQERSRSEEKTVAGILSWLQTFRDIPPEQDTPWDWSHWGRGVTAQDAAERFGWSVGVAEEELGMAEERGALCREASLEGTRFWQNWLINVS